MRIRLMYFSEIKQEVIEIGSVYDLEKHDHHWWALNANTQMWYEETDAKGIIMFWMIENGTTDLWPEDSIDAAEVLRKYVRLIADEEGSNPAFMTRNAYFSDVKFTPKEWDWLAKIGEEMYDGERG